MKKIILLSLLLLMNVLVGCKGEKEAQVAKPIAVKKPTPEAVVPQFGDGMIVNDGLSGSLALSSIASWSKVANAKSYEVAIGTIPGSNDIKDWVDVGEATYASVSIFSTLNNGQVYYTNIRAISSEGEAGSIKSGDGWVAIGQWKIDTLAKRFNDLVYKSVFDKDQNQYVVGDFSSINAPRYNNIIMLNPNGSVETSIDFGAGFNNSVIAKSLSNGKIMVGGTASLYKGASIKKIIRLNSDASIDNGFDLDSGVNSEIRYIHELEVDGLGNTYAIYSVVVGSGFKVVKINSDGSLNNDFELNYGTDRLQYFSGLSITSDNKLILSDVDLGVRVIDTDASLEAGFGSDIFYSKKMSNGNILSIGFSKIVMYDSSYNPVISFNNNISNFGNDYHWYNGAIETSDGGFIIYGDADETFSGIRKFLPSGLEDSAFNSIVGGGVIFGDQITDVAKTSDNKLIITGNFRTFNSQTVAYGITKLNSNGSRDASFIPIAGGFNWGDRRLNIFPDDKILVTGTVYTFGGTRVNSIAKIKKDKTLDQVFLSNLRVDGFITDIAFQKNSIWIIGHFTRVNGHVANGIAKLNLDGTSDTSFNARNGIKAEYADQITVLKDGNLLLTGPFSKFNNYHTFGIVKVLKDGSRDASFNVGSSFNATVKTVEELADGKLIVGGDFTTYRGVSVNNIVKLLPNGSIDQSFISGSGFNNSVKKLKVLTTGKILLFGSFTTYNGQSHEKLIRLNGDGSVDQDFDVGNSFDGAPAMEFTQDGQMIFAGNTSSFNNNATGPMFRLNSDGALDQSLDATYLDLLDISATDNISLSPDGRIFLFGYFPESNSAYSYNKEMSW